MSAAVVADAALEPGPPPRRSIALDRLACIAVLAVGAGLRAREYFADRALWLDELLVGYSILGQGYRGLLRPLPAKQAAPVGWLWMEHTDVLLFGRSEWALRLAPFLLSLGALVAFFFLVRRWLSGISAVLACAMFAVAPDLIRYSVEVKQYGSDVFFVVLVVVLATRFYDRGTKTATAVWALGGVVAMWSSHAAALTLAATTATVLVLAFRAGRRLVMAAIVTSCLGASAVTEYFANLRAVSKITALQAYWAPGLRPRSVSFGGAFRWLRTDLVKLATDPLHFAFPAAALIALGAGSVVLVARRGLAALVVVVPIAFAMVAALTRKYPLEGRLSLYLLPLAFVVLAALTLHARPLYRSPVAMIGLVVALVVAWPLHAGLDAFTKPIDVENSRSPYAFVAQRWERGDVLVTDGVGEAAYDYYGPRFRLTRTYSVNWEHPNPRCNSWVSFHGLLHFRRVWLVLTHRPTYEPVQRTSDYFADFSVLGAKGATYYGAGNTAAGVFDIAHARDTRGRLARDVDDECLSLDRAPSRAHAPAL